MEGGKPREGVFRFDAFELDAAEKELRKHGIRVKLQQQPFLVLCRLLERPNHLVTREELRSELWSDETFVDFDHSLNEAVNKLRLALGDSATNPRFVETVPKHGYRFIGTVEGERTPPPELRPPAKRSRLTLYTLVASLLVVGTLAVRYASRRSPPVSTAAIRAVAVLPLENLSGDPSQEYFSDGMTEELIAHLSMIEALHVISPTSVRRYKGSDKSLKQIAADLRVDAIIEGSVRLANDRVRVTVHLADPKTEQSLWSEFYEGAADDLFAIQMELAKTIAREILLELPPQDEARLVAGKERKPEAYQAFLKGRYHWNRRTEADFLKAIEYFNEALSYEPDYARAYAGLADTYNLLAVYNMQRHRRAMPRAKDAALRAIALDPKLADSHASLGCIHFLYDWDFPGSEREFQKAIEVNPRYPTAYQWYGIYLVSRGRTDEALEMLRRALELDPMSLSINENLGWALYVARRYPEAIAQFEKTLDLDPEFGQGLRYLGLTYLHVGRTEDALRVLERARAAFHGEAEIRADLALAFALAGHRGEARALLDELMLASEERYVSPFLIARFHTGLGEADEALDWLDKAYEDRVANIVFIGVDPFFDSLRALPRFRDLLDRIGLSEIG
ncbi:MAG TPA: tetratricopeptide repeat protein [Vicinamibacteria bacterium]|nr:tetratricopeptide repeat protein [Vicinamibacteria bacterium]